MNKSRLCPVLWIIACATIAIWTVMLAVVTVRRIGFPWDTYYWSEGPFLVNMLKLYNHAPIYGPPADGNSFVYAPGLEYLCFALLKPFGLELDIRFCRIVTFALGVMASFFAALAIGRISKPLNPATKGWVRFLAAWGVAWLVLSKNFMADICHPDNLQAFHAVSVFWLCLTALETRRFSLALATMLWAGFGVFAKQTGALAFLGPAVVFAWFNPWGWRRWMVLAGCGVVMAAVSLYVLWLPQYARFYTLELMSHQGISIRKFAHAVIDFLWKDRGVLLVLAAIAAFYLWDLGANCRRYLICWSVVGFFSVMPNMVAYLKIMGAYNNLILFEVWFIMIAWPVFLKTLDGLRAGSTPDETNKPAPVYARYPAARCWLMVLLLLLLMPLKRAPLPVHYEYCQKIEDSVRQDLQAGRRVLVSHGTEFLIRAGMKSVPLDRGNSILELWKGGKGALAETQSRLRAHYYDRIYLLVPVFYGDEILAEIKRDYMQDSAISKPAVVMGFEEGFGAGFMDADCVVLIPRREAASL